MNESDKSGIDNSQELLRHMMADSQDAVDMVIHFVNDDVPKYLDNLRRFHEESRKVEIFVGLAKLAQGESNA